MEVIYSGKCNLLKRNVAADVKVHRDKIIFTSGDNVLRDVKYKDALCCTSHKTKENVSITLLSYPLVKAKLGKRYKRVRRSLTFAIEDKSPFTKSLDLAGKLEKLIRGLDPNDYDVDLRRKPLFVLVNPVGGRGKGRKIYEKHVKKMFTEASIDHDVVFTERSGHAFDIAADLEVSKWRGIVLVSGDGLVYEVINGLMSRPDWDEAIKTPLGLVPGGSGNALTASVIYETTGKHYIDDIITMGLFEICKGSPVPLDVVSVETMENGKVEDGTGERGRVLYSFLFSIVGLIADCDIESEKLRFLGGDVRDAIYGILRILTLRKYHATVSFHRVEDGDRPVQSTSFAKNGNATTQQKLLTTPLLSEPVPDDWEVQSGDYVQVMASYLSHIATGKIITNKSKLSDGLMILHTLGGDISRASIIGLWGGIEEGEGADKTVEQLNDSGSMIAQCDMFRVEPKRMHSEILDIDGERLPLSAYQCQIHKGLARVFASI